MDDISHKNYTAMSDAALAQHIGAFVKHHRVAQNKTQEVMAQEAGMSRSTLSLLERGEPVTLATLIQALRVLDKLHVFDVFSIPKTISPMMVAEMEMKMRKRARGKNTKKGKTPPPSDW